MRSRLRRYPRLVWSCWVLICAGVVVVALPSPARGDTSLGGWTVAADGNGVDIVIDNATGLAGVHPLTEMDLPKAESTFSSGPFGSTLAAVFWPGSAGGNFGSLSAELPIPAQLQPLLAKTNDPVRATAQYPAGPVDARYPAGAPGGVAEMVAHADAKGTRATAALGNEQVAGLIGFGSVRGTSSSTASSTATATSSSDVKNISLLGGLIQIGSVTSTATATSNGHTSSGHAVTHIGAVTVLGQPASISTDGLVLPTTLSNSLGPVIGPVVQSLLSQTVTALGLTVTAVPSTETHNGPAESVFAGGVRLEVVPNAVLISTLVATLQKLEALLPLPPQLATVTTLPGVAQGATLTITLGRVTASANASPPFNTTFNPPPVPPTPLPTSPSSTGVGGTPAIPGSSTFVPGTPGSSAVAPSFAPTLSPATSPTSSGSAQPLLGSISLSSPLGVAQVIIGLLAAAAAAYGLWRLARLLLPQDLGPECPLGQENP